MKKDLFTSLICSIAFSLVVVACGGGKHNLLPSLTGDGIALLAGSGSSSHLVVKGGHPIMASLFQAPVTVNLAQSFDANCESYSVQGAPQNAFVPIPSSGNACNAFVTVPSTVDGKRIHDPGTLSNLVVDVRISGGDTVSCVDKTDGIPVLDSQKVRAYFQPDSGKVSVVANDNVTALACSISVPAGTQIASIEAEWVKQ